MAAADVGHPTSPVLQQVVPGSKEAARTWACVGDRVEVSVEVEVPNRRVSRSASRILSRSPRRLAEMASAFSPCNRCVLWS